MGGNDTTLSSLTAIPSEKDGSKSQAAFNAIVDTAEKLILSKLTPEQKKAWMKKNIKHITKGTTKRAKQYNNIFATELRPRTDEEVLTYCRDLARQHEVKFRAGMAKYNTPIWDKHALKEAKQELLDFMSYLTLAELQQARAMRCVEHLEFYYPALAKDRFFIELKNMLGDKPLAVKVKE